LVSRGSRPLTRRPKLLLGDIGREGDRDSTHRMASS
jgi:hypothetical protein